MPRLFVLLLACGFSVSASDSPCKLEYQRFHEVAKSSTQITPESEPAFNDLLRCAAPGYMLRRENTPAKLIYHSSLPLPHTFQIPHITLDSLYETRNGLIQKFLEDKYGQHRCVQWTDKQWKLIDCGGMDLSKAIVDRLEPAASPSPEFEVKDVRGLVVSRPSHWESLDYLLFFDSEAGDMHLIIGGSYQPGRSSAPPPKYSYSLDHDYPTELSDYGKHFKAELSDYLSQ